MISLILLAWTSIGLAMLYLALLQPISNMYYDKLSAKDKCLLVIIFAVCGPVFLLFRILNNFFSKGDDDDKK